MPALRLAANATPASAINMLGGDYKSTALNINAGRGTLRVAVGEAMGTVNITLGCSSFGAATPNLQFGTLNTTGDPTYFNTAGSLTLTSVPKTAGGDLALVASGDVVVVGGTLNTTNANGGKGGNITIIAGENVTSSSAVSANGDVSTRLTVKQSGLPTHGSTTGGAIDLSQLSTTDSIDTTGTLTLTSTNFSGGNVTLIAFSGSGAGSLRMPGSINIRS